MHQPQLNTLIGLALKSDEIVELLEYFDLSVVYEFDRLNEGTEDIYWVSAHDAGFQLKFGQDQVLRTVFAHAKPRDGFSAADPKAVGTPFYDSLESAQHAFKEAGVSCKAGQPPHLWVRGEFAEYAVHYEFDAWGELALVTLMARAA